ncbi:MAG: thioredoxin family protein [Deltaproteobacteria bacterium]|nr:thioredoxin family protein [Deltaproteobacteria bacterium]MBN2674165.1 thioredoxin family protein [Deltaproteobacteria bacterium]
MGFLYVVLGIVGGFFALMIGMRLLIQLKSAKMKGKTAPSLAGKPGKWIQKGKNALFYFYSPSCGACAAMTPVVKNLAKSNDGVFPIDISRDMDTARKFNVMATPTLVVVKNKIVEDITIGPQPPATIEGMLAS